MTTNIRLIRPYSGEISFRQNTLQTESKALSNPQAVISSLASANGQACLAYKGKLCIHLDDTNAMQAVCGDGNTVVGWDDAGCGSGSCVSSNFGETMSKHSTNECFLALRQTDLLSHERST